MRKYFLTSLLSLLLITGTGVMLSASDNSGNGTCCKNKTTEATQSSNNPTATTQNAECGSTEIKAETQTTEVQIQQTSNTEKSSCTGTTSTATSTTNVQTQGGECTKVPAGVGGQRASREP